ncbi:zinc-ribbon domain-containing protein [Dinghuibacter silviterrae]|uniref:Zinc ribbon family protein n=1 Tax=Dinghuibacter silviterrae TaxID=1539049 RepID=A0A4R8DUH3_9BACT|nr:zinc-ribbon domain-containing protein [Dinghuibacter silviterrae]TDX02032.1 zinc ribbon family protein [Dinghuibacter silviterrae]
MLFLLIKGTRTVPIGVEEQFMFCSNCRSHSVHDIMVSSRYFHVYNIPVMPLDKHATVFCHTCGSQRGFEMDKDIKSRFKHPWNTYLLAAIVVIFIALVVLSKLW